MQASDFEHFKNLLVEREHLIADWLNSGSTVKSGEADMVRGLLTQIKEALSRIEDHSFGHCDYCEGTVEMHRLEIQPERRICLDCISKEEKAALEEDLFLATRIHRALLPQTFPVIDGFELGVRSESAGSIGGDYYDIIPGHNGEWTRIVIADAMGHGLPAGLLMSNLQGALRVLSADIDSPAPLITRLNQWLCRNVPVTKFISMVCLCLKQSDGSGTRVAYGNAGHPPPLVVRADGSVEQLDATGTVMGVHEEFNYEEGELTLFSGDHIVLYTDGVTEAKSAGGEEFEQERLSAFILERRKGPFDSMVDDLLKTVVKFTGNQPLQDDITALILRRK